MKKNIIYIFALGLSLLGSAMAQPPVSGNVTVCLKGDHIVHSSDLRSFTVIVSGEQGERSGYLELQTAASSQSNSFAITAPKNIKVIEPNNSSFSCSALLQPNVRSVEVTIHYPPDFLPYCVITSSSQALSECTNR